MRKLFQQLSVLGLASFCFTMLAASAVAQQAKIVKMVGTGGATIVVNGVTAPAADQMLVPENADINTGNVEVYLEVVSGVVATVKPNSVVHVGALTGPQPELELRQGRLVSQIDKKRVTGTYQVRTAKGVAAARGTSFTVEIGGSSFSITTTADVVQFTSPTAGSISIQAGMILFTPAGSTTPSAPMPLATAAASNPAVAAIVRDAVATVSTVVQNNLGSISAETATNLVSQVVAAAVAAIPTEAATFTTQAVTAVTAAGSATAGSPDTTANAAGAVTAAAVQSAPDQAATIAGAAATAAPTQTGVITAAAQQVAPTQSTAIVQQVSTSTGQSTAAVQNSATNSAGAAANAVTTATNATQNVVPPPPAPVAPAPPPPPPQTPPPQTTPVTPIDPSISVSPST